MIFFPCKETLKIQNIHVHPCQTLKWTKEWHKICMSPTKWYEITGKKYTTCFEALESGQPNSTINYVDEMVRLTYYLKMDGWKTNSFPFGKPRPMFRCYVMYALGMDKFQRAKFGTVPFVRRCNPNRWSQQQPRISTCLMFFRWKVRGGDVF